MIGSPSQCNFDPDTIPTYAHLPPAERYQRDVMFRHLVDSLRCQLDAANYTPTELREAVIVAATMHEAYTIRRYYISCHEIESPTSAASELSR
jgi:hypothetical protein